MFFEKTLLYIHMRRGSRARSKAFLTIAACQDVVDVGEAVESMCIQLSLISAARHLFSVFFSPKIGFMLKIMFLKFLSLTLSIIYLSFFSDFFASIVLQNKISIAEKSLFSLFMSLFFIFIFVPFFFAPSVLPRRSDGRGQDTSPREMSEGNGRNGHRDLKRRSLLGVI